MEWDLCSSAPCVPFYYYTTFDNPMPKPSCQKSRKTRITEKVLVIQSSNIVHYDQHMQKPACVDFQAFSSTFSLYKLTYFIFFHFLSGGVQQTAKNFTDCCSDSSYFIWQSRCWKIYTPIKWQFHRLLL